MCKADFKHAISNRKMRFYQNSAFEGFGHMSFLGAHTIPKLGLGVSTNGFLDFLMGGIGDGSIGIRRQTMP